MLGEKGRRRVETDHKKDKEIYKGERKGEEREEKYTMRKRKNKVWMEYSRLRGKS